MQRLSGIFLCFTFFVCSTTLYSQRTGNYTGKSFIKYFPDTSLAEFVANLLHKQITDYVTIKELAGIKGDFDIGVVPVTNLTGIGYLTGIDSFHCYKNEVTAIPAEIGNLKNLKSLNLFNNDIKSLPNTIAELDNLSYLNVFDNFKLSESYKRYLPVLLRKKQRI